SVKTLPVEPGGNPSQRSSKGRLRSSLGSTRRHRGRQASIGRQFERLVGALPMELALRAPEVTVSGRGTIYRLCEVQHFLYAVRAQIKVRTHQLLQALFGD